MTRIIGVSRVAENDKCLLVSFAERPSDDDLRALHSAPVAQGGRGEEFGRQIIDAYCAQAFPNANRPADVPEVQPAPLMGERACRECGCTEFNACRHPDHGNCWWVAPDLCSHCDNGWGNVS